MEKLIQHPIYKDYYADLESGEVYSCKFNKIKKLKLYNSRGYLQFNIMNNKEKICKKLHAFIFECGTQQTYEYSTSSSEGLTINHIDSNKLNNKFQNLELRTNRWNAKDGTDKKYKSKSDLPKYVRLNKTSLENGWCNPYYVQIRIKGKYKHFGYFTSIEEAEQVAKAKFQELYPNEIY